MLVIRPPLAACSAALARAAAGASASVNGLMRGMSLGALEAPLAADLEALDSHADLLHRRAGLRHRPDLAGDRRQVVVGAVAGDEAVLEPPVVCPVEDHALAGRVEARR